MPFVYIGCPELCSITGISHATGIGSSRVKSCLVHFVVGPSVARSGVQSPAAHFLHHLLQPPLPFSWMKLALTQSGVCALDSTFLDVDVHQRRETSGVRAEWSTFSCFAVFGSPFPSVLSKPCAHTQWL